MSYDHQAHILRPHEHEWCGGTEPPTIVTINEADGELAVDIFAHGSNLHVGEILQPVATKRFLTEPYDQFGPLEVSDYAIRALRTITQR